MYISCGLFLRLALATLFAVAGLAAAQDTNFSTGPQYLLTNGSPLFARPIATPSLSLGTYQPQAIEHDASSAAPLEAGNPPAQSASNLLPPVDLYSIYYGTPRVQEIAISFHASEIEGAAQRQPPASILETGVTQLIDARTVRQYELTLAESAAEWKGRKTAARRTYTNADIERLRQGS